MGTATRPGRPSGIITAGLTCVLRMAGDSTAAPAMLGIEMTDRDALLQAVIAEPDDDAPRLVFADWCDENGQSERAELIRRQCEAYRLIREEDERIEDQLKGISDEVARAMRAADLRSQRQLSTDRLPARAHRHLFPELPVRWGWVWEPAYLRFEFKRPGHRFILRRGFVEGCTLRWNEWLAHGSAVAGANPVRYVQLIGPRPRHTRVAGDTYRGEWRSLPPALVPLVPAVIEANSDSSRYLRRRRELSDILLRLARDDFQALGGGRPLASRRGGARRPAEAR